MIPILVAALLWFQNAPMPSPTSSPTPISVPEDRPEPILIPNHRVGVYRIEFSPSDQWLLTFGGDNRLIVWDVGSRRPVLAVWLPKNRKSFAVTFSSDSSKLLMLNGNRLTTYPLGAGNASETTLKPFSEPPCEVSVSPDGAYVASRACYPGGLEIQPVQSGRRVIISSEEWKDAEDLTWSGHCIAGGKPNAIRSFDAQTGKPCSKQEWERGRSAGELQLVKSSPNHYKIRSSRPQDGQTQTIKELLKDEFEEVAVSHKGQYVAVVEKVIYGPLYPYRNRPWRIYYVPTRTWLDPDAPEFAPIVSLHFMDEGFVSIDKNTNLAAWGSEPLERGDARALDLMTYQDLAISSNGKATGGLTYDRKKYAHLLDSDSKITFDPVATKIGIDTPPRLQVSNDGKWLAYITSEGYRRYLQLDGPIPQVVCDAKESERIQFAFSNDSKLLAVSCVGKLAVVDLANGSVLPPRAQVAVSSPVAFESTEGWLVTASDDGLDFRDSSSLDIRRHFGAGAHINAMAFDNSEKFGAVQLASGNIVMFSYEENDPPSFLEFPISERDARILAFSRTGAMLLSAGDDGLIRFWDVTTGKLRAIAAHSTHSEFELSPSKLSAKEGDWIVVTPEGPFDSSGRGLYGLTWRRPSDGTLYPGSLFFSDLYTPGILALLEEPRPNLPTGWDIIGPLRFPGLAIFLNQSGATVRRGKSSSELCLKSLPPSTVELYFEGEKQAWDTTQFSSHANDPSCPFGLPLPAQVQAEFLTRFEASKGATLHTPWDGVRDARIAPRIHFQSIWIEKYNLGRTTYKPLKFGPETEQVLRDAFTELQRRGDLSDKLVYWKTLKDEEATRKGILSRLREISDEAAPEDLVILYLAGHGVVPQGRSMFHFVTYDADHSTDLSFERSTISSADLADAFRHLKAKRVIVLLETCQSGAALEGLAKAAESVASLEMVFADLDKKSGIRNQLRGISFYLLASASPLHTSGLTQNEPGRLASAFAGGLHSEITRAVGAKDAQSTVWISQLFAAIQSQTKTWPGSQQTVLRSIGFDFPVVVVRR